MVLVQNWPFSQLSFLANIGQQNVFYHIVERRKAFAKKARNLESQKMDFFPKRLQHGFGPNLAIFRIYFFGQYSLTKCVLSYSRTKKRLSWLKKQEVKKSIKLRFFKRG